MPVAVADGTGGFASNTERVVQVRGSVRVLVSVIIFVTSQLSFSK